MSNKNQTSYTNLTMAILVGMLLAIAPARSSAGDSEDALKECVLLCHGIAPCVAGCLTGYVIFGNSNNPVDSVPRFDHLDLSVLPPLGPFGNEMIVFEPGDLVTLRSGRWTGCPPDCQDTGRFLSGPGPVSKALFSIVANEDLFAASDYDSAPWMTLGEGRFDRRTNFWTLRWDTSDFAENTGYSLRVDFLTRTRAGEVFWGRGVTVAVQRAVPVEPRRPLSPSRQPK